MNWQPHKYSPEDEERKSIEVEMERPAPTNSIRVRGDVTHLTLHELIRITAQLNGFNLRHNFKNGKGDDKQVSLIDTISMIGTVMPKQAISSIESQHEIAAWKTGHPVYNKDNV